MNNVRRMIAAGTFAVALFGAAGASAGPYYYYGYGAYAPAYYGYWYQPYAYTVPLAYYAPVMQCWTYAGPWSGFWRPC